VLILASASPRRKELLASVGLEFRVEVSPVEELAREGEPVEKYVMRLAAEKGAAVALKNPDAWVIAADTVVYIDERILEKPSDPSDARRMLAEIAGREHTVYSGVSLRNEKRGRHDSRWIATKVTMAPMSAEQIFWYVATGEPLDKAGSYAVQGIGAMFVERIEGNYTNVVGLPLPLLYRMFRDAGVELLQAAANENGDVTKVKG
jgi:septum formation protein